MDANILQLKEYVRQSQDTVAITGAGISYLYGMSRLKQQTNRMDLMHRLSPQYVKKHPEEFYRMMYTAFLEATFEKGPSTVHRQLAEMEERGMLSGIVTQNMDCLHTVAGSKNVVEFQGSFADNVCVDCGERVEDYTVWGHGEAPRCPKCGAPLMPANFSRGLGGNSRESAELMNRAASMIAGADLAIIIGTTGFRSEEYLSQVTSRTTLVQINPGSTRFDDMVQLNLRMDAAAVLDEILSGDE